MKRKNNTMLNALKGLNFLTRFSYSFNALGYRQRSLLWSDYPADFRDQAWLVEFLDEL